MCGGSGGSKGGGGGGADAFNPAESIHTGAINENLRRVKSGELNREESVRQYNSELRKAQKQLKGGSGNSQGWKEYKTNQINAIKYAIRETKKL